MSLQTWHLIAEWLHCPEGCTDPDECEARREDFPVEAEDYDGALAEARQRHPTAMLDLAWVEWEPWPGLILEISDYPRWETVHDSSWTGHGYLMLRDAVPVPPGLERESLRISAEKVRRLIDGHGQGDGVDGERHPGWRVHGGWLVHDDADRLGLAAKSLDDEPARCLAYPRIREIVAGPHEYAPILGLDEHGEVVVLDREEGMSDRTTHRWTDDDEGWPIFSLMGDFSNARKELARVQASDDRVGEVLAAGR